MRHQRPAHDAASSQPRFPTEILADARELQSCHAPRLLGTLASRIRGPVSSRSVGDFNIVSRHLVVH